MINFNSIPADVQQFMIDKMTDDVSRHSIWVLIMCLICIAFLVLWIILMIKKISDKPTSIMWICFEVAFLAFGILSFCSDKAKLEQYQNNPRIAVTEYIKTAYSDDGYCNELYVRGVDIYGNYED